LSTGWRAEDAGALRGLPARRRSPSPRGWPRDHPRIALLRRGSFTAHRHFPPEPWLHERTALERAREAWRAAEPLRDWLDRVAGV